MYFKDQCLFWSLFGTVQVGGSISRFLVVVFWETHWIPPFLFWASKKPLSVKDKRAEDKVHCYSMPDYGVCRDLAILILTGCTVSATQQLLTFSIGPVKGHWQHITICISSILKQNGTYKWGEMFFLGRLKEIKVTGRLSKSQPSLLTINNIYLVFFKSHKGTTIKNTFGEMI